MFSQKLRFIEKNTLRLLLLELWMHISWFSLFLQIFYVHTHYLKLRKDIKVVITKIRKTKDKREQWSSVSFHGSETLCLWEENVQWKSNFINWFQIGHEMVGREFKR